MLGSTPSSISNKEKLTPRNRVTQDTWDMKRFSVFLLLFFVMTIIHNLQTWCRRKNKKSDIISIKFPTSSSLQSAFHLKPILTLMTQFIYVQVKCENRLYPPPHPTAFHGLSFHKPMNLFYHFTPLCRSPSFCVNWECLSCFIKAGSEFPFKSIIL